jgi:hypothetical protein
MNKGHPIMEWLEIEPSDLKGITYEELSARYRKEHIVVLTMSLPTLSSTVVILLSPIGSVFCAPFLWEELWFHDIDDNDENRKAYMRILRKAGLKKADPQAELFGQFSRSFNDKKQMPSLSVSARYLEDYRVQPYAFQDKYKESVFQYIERLYSQLGRWALVSQPEDATWNDEIYETLDYFIMTWLFDALIIDREWRSQAKLIPQKVFTALKQAVELMEQGEHIDLIHNPLDQIRRHVSIAFPMHRCQADEVEPLAVDILSYRSRYIRLYGHPVYLLGPSGALKALPNLRKQWPELSSKCKAPYNPVEEIERYIDEMLNRFPALGESPFEIQ